MKRISRREFLRGAAGAAFVLISAGCDRLPFIKTAKTGIDNEAPIPDQVTSEFAPDVEVHLHAAPRSLQILPGQPTSVWSYQGTLVRGEPGNLQTLKDSYLGPLIRVRKGQKLRIRFSHELGEPSIIHWHGLLLPAGMDGHPRDAIQPGQAYVYEFEVANRAGTYWYHPHPDLLTGAQVLRGLAGLFLVTDDEEAVSGLPSGDYDIPLVIQDRTFGLDNEIILPDGESMPGMANMEMLMGFLGERILVNGQVNPLLPVATRAYRLRLLNGSNSRVYKLAWGHGSLMTVLATDGGLLEKPVQRPYVMIGPGERVEIWADFSQFPVGSETSLVSLPFLGAEGDSLLTGGVEAPMAGMGHGGMSAASTPESPSTPSEGDMSDYNPVLPNGSGFTVLQIRVERNETERTALPESLSTIERFTAGAVSNASQPRRFVLSMRNSAWLVNGRSFAVGEVAPDEVVRLNSLEIWEFVNEQNPGEAMEKMGMVHPMHIHGVQFQVIGRQVLVPELQAGWDSVREGFVEEGWKDTFLIMPGERVRLLLKPSYSDVFLYHCHNLEHEDLGMMRNFRVEP